MGKKQYRLPDDQTSNEDKGMSKRSYTEAYEERYGGSSTVTDEVDIKTDEVASKAKKGLKAVGIASTLGQPKWLTDHFGEQIDMGDFMREELGQEPSPLESAWSEGHFSPEAFGKTDAHSVEQLSKVTDGLSKEKAVLRRLNKLYNDAEKGEITRDKYNAGIKDILGEEVDGIDENGKTIKTREGGLLSKYRKEVNDEWSKIEGSYIHDLNKGINLDNYGVGLEYVEQDVIGKDGKPVIGMNGKAETETVAKYKIMTGRDFERNYQGVTVVEGADVQSNDYIETYRANLLSPAHDDFMSIENQMLKAKKDNGIHVLGDAFTKNALNGLNSKNPDIQRASYEWLEHIMKNSGTGTGYLLNASSMYAKIDQIKTKYAGHPNLKYALYGGSTLEYLQSNKKEIQQQWNNLSQAQKDSFVEQAASNGGDLGKYREFYPVTQNKSVSDYQNDVRAWKEIGRWEKEWDKNKAELRTKVLNIKDVKKPWADLAVRHGGPFAEKNIITEHGSPAQKAYELAINADGTGGIGFKNWVNKLGASQWTTTRHEESWLPFGWGDENIKYTENILEHLGFGKTFSGRKVNDYESFKQNIYDYDRAVNKAIGGDKAMFQLRGAERYVANQTREGKWASEAKLKNYYNAIIADYKKGYDEIKMNDLYEHSLIYGGLGNNSALSLTTIGLDGEIDPDTKALKNTGTEASDGQLSKQHNFSKVHSLLRNENGWEQPKGSYMPHVAVTRDFVHDMTKSDFNNAAKHNAGRLDEFFDKGKDLSRMQMTFMKYSTVPGHSVYKLSNPGKTEGTNSTNTIYLTIANDKLKEVEEDNFTWTKNNWIQEVFNLDGELDLTNRLGTNDKYIFKDTPKLINNNNQYAIQYNYVDSEGNDQSMTNDIGYIGAMTVEDAQRIANQFLDQKQAEQK